MTKSKWLLASLLLSSLLVFFLLDLGDYLTLAQFKSQQAAIEAYCAAHLWRTTLIFSFIYIALAVLSLPGAALMTLIAGAIFGAFWGTVLVSFASTLAAAITFLASRFLLRDTMQYRFAATLKVANEGMEKDGALYLFLLRLSPLFPFFVVNVVMGLTSIKTLTFIWVSQVGMLTGTFVFVNAGAQIAELDSLADILSPGLIASLTLLGFCPLIAKRLIDLVRARRLART